MPTNTYKTREEWLTALARKMEEVLFKPRNKRLPKYRVSCSFPHARGLAAKHRTIGQCWSPTASQDKTTEVMVSPTQADDMAVAAVLAHELVHCAVGVEHGHGKPFRDLALAIGLGGKMTATVAGPDFKAKVQPMLDYLGPYPHAVLDQSMRKKQSTRLLKAECPSCGYTVRLSRKWANVGVPICPQDHEDMILA